jgi:hypothetical protein
MICERYRTWMSDAALHALQPAREAEFSDHVRVCAACRADIERMQKLVVAVDAGVAAIVAGEPSPALAARVRQRIAEETAAPQWRITSWIPVAAGALALLALVSIWLIRREPAHQPNVASHGAVESPAKPVSPAVVPRRPQVASRETPRLARPPHAHRPAASAGARLETGGEPEILVPPEEWSGVASLYSAMQTGRVDGTLLVASAKNLGKPLAVDELKIAPIEIPKLDKDEEDN